MPRAALFDGDQISSSTGPYPRKALHVVFLNCHPHNMQEKINEIDRINRILVKENGWSEVEVVLCDDSPEAVDLEILLWQRNNPGYYCHEPITGDLGLKRAFKEKVVPEGHADRLPTGGAGLRSFPTTAVNGLSSAQDIIRELAGEAAEQAYIEVSSQNPGYPWWAKLAHVSYQCPAARLVFPLGAHGNGPGRDLATLARQIFDGKPAATLPQTCNIPDPPPLHPAPPLGRAVQAVPGLLLQVEIENPGGAHPQYDWVALKHHCPAGIQQTIETLRSVGKIPLANLPDIESELTKSTLPVPMPAQPLRATVCAAINAGDPHRPDRVEGKVRAKRLDFAAYPSRGSYSLWSAMDRWLPGEANPKERQEIKIEIDRFLSSLSPLGHYAIVPDVALQRTEDPIRRGQLRWDAFFLAPQDPVRLEVTPGTPLKVLWAGGSLIGLGVIQTPRPSPFQKVLGLMHRSTVHLLLPMMSTSAASMSIDLEVSRCIHPLAYELIAPALVRGEGSAGGPLQ